MRPGRESAALARALIVDKKEAVFLSSYRSSRAAAKNILFYWRAFLTGGVEEEFVNVPVQLLCARLQNRVDVAASIAPLAGVIQRRLHLKFLNDVGIRQRNIRCLRHVVIGGADSFDQKVVVVLALSIYEQLYAAPAQLRRGVQFALRASGKRQQLLIVLRRQRKLADRFRSKRLARCGVGGFNGRHLRRNLDSFADGAWFQRDGYSCGFRHAHFDSVGLGLRKSRLIDHYRVSARRQQRHNKRAVRSRG